MENKQDMTKVANPSCLGSKWYQAEEDQLLENLRKGIPLKTIANLHNRTYGGISARISVMAYKFYKGGMSINDISEKFNLTVSNIEDRVNIAEEKNTRKTFATIPINHECDCNEKLKSIHDELKIIRGNLVRIIR